MLLQVRLAQLAERRPDTTEATSSNLVPHTKVCPRSSTDRAPIPYIGSVQVRVLPGALPSPTMDDTTDEPREVVYSDPADDEPAYTSQAGDDEPVVVTEWDGPGRD